MEVSCINCNTTLCDHITCNRAVDTTGQKEHCSSIGSYRHTTGTREGLRIETNALSDLDVDTYLGFMYINLQTGELLEDTSSHLARNGHGI